MNETLDRRDFAEVATLTLEEFKAHADHRLSAADVRTLADMAPLLAGLARNTDLLTSVLNERAEAWFTEREYASAMTVPFAKGLHYRLDAVAWPTEEELASGRLTLEEVPYGIAADHSAHRLVAGYLGPGYEEDTYLYDRALVQGFAGEPVALRKLGRFCLRPGTVVLHPAGRHVHVRRPPSQLSFSLVLAVATPAMAGASSYYFDVDAQRIIGEPLNVDATVRASVLELASLGGGGRPNPLVDRLARQHPDPQVRLAAYEALSLSAVDAAEVWSAALEDAHPMVVEGAKKRLPV